MAVKSEFTPNTVHIVCKFGDLCYNDRMKRVIEVEGMCCKRCAERAEKKLMLLDGVSGAKANFKKGIIFVECEITDEALAACVTDAGFTVKEIRERKGIFG